MKYHDLLNEWINLHKFSISESSFLNYSNSMVRINEYMGDENIEDISNKSIQAFFIKYHSLGYSGNTLINFSKIISMSFKYAVLENYIPFSPYVNIIIPKGSYKEIIPFTKDEVCELLTVPMLQWAKDAIEIAYRTGMRKGEIFALSRPDVNIGKQFLMVNHTQSLTKNGVILKRPKTKHSRRRIDIDDYATEILERRLYGNDCEFVFSRDGKMLIPWSLPYIVKSKCKEAKVRPHTFHDLRHGHAPLLLEHNVHPKIVQERLGHSSISVTLDTYSHLIPSMQRTAVEISNSVILS